jgi:hypothetical protein
MYSIRRNISSLVAAAALALLASIAIPTAAQASARGSVSWSFTADKVDAGSAIDVTYKPSGIRAGSLLSFQRQFGTAKVWKSVAKFHVLSDSSATETLPGAPQGGYEYRVLVTSGRTIIALTHDLPLYSYGPVSF